MPESELGAVSYVKNTGKSVRRVFDHIGQRLFFVQRRTPVEMIGVPFWESVLFTQMDYFTVTFFTFDHWLNTFLPSSDVLLNAWRPAS